MWKSSNDVAKAEIDYTLTNRPGIITDVTVINQVNIGSDHKLVMSNIKLDVEMEMKKLMTKRTARVDATRIGSRTIFFWILLFSLKGLFFCPSLGITFGCRSSLK